MTKELFSLSSASLWNELLNGGFLVNPATTQTNNFPFYNLIQESDDQYILEIAVAGFAQEDLNIVVEKGTLYISGVVRAIDIDAKKFVHHGISSKSFEKSFHLGEYVNVTSADLKNGILVVNLQRIIPEDKKAKKIQIG